LPSQLQLRPYLGTRYPVAIVAPVASTLSFPAQSPFFVLFFHCTPVSVRPPCPVDFSEYVIVKDYFDSKSRVLVAIQIDQNGQLEQGVTLIQMRHQRIAEQLAGLREFWLWTHKNLVEICKETNRNISYSCNLSNGFSS
jgi:hypothetical protein